METATTALPSGLTIEELLDWRPEFGVLTVCVEIDPGDRGEGWLIELRNQLNAAVEAGGRRARPREGPESRRAEGPRPLRGRGAALGTLPDRLLRSQRRSDGPATSGRGPNRRLSHERLLRGSAQLTPLLELLDEGAAVGVVAVSAERIHLYEWKLGSLELVHDWEAEMYSLDWRERKAGKPSDVARTQGAASSGRDQYDQRLEHNRARFLKEAGRLTADEARSRSWRRVIGFGDPEHLREFDEGAEKGTEVELAEAVDVISEDRGKLLERVNAAVADGNRRRESALIERAVEGARTPGGHGALGLIDVQRSLNEGRVEHLLFDADTAGLRVGRPRGRDHRASAPHKRD